MCPPDSVGERYIEMRDGRLATEDDAQPLLAKGGAPAGEAAEEEETFAAATLLYPLPSASYTCSEHSWVSKLVFSWVNPVLDKFGDLQLGDAFMLPADLTAAILSERFEIAWNATVSSGHPSTTSAFHALFAR